MRRALLIASLAFAAGTAQAAVAPPLATGTIDPSLLLPPPPAEGGPVAAEEIGELHRMQARRTPAETEHARADGKTKDVSIFDKAVGVDLLALPATRALFDLVRAEEKRDADAAKAVFKRKRPWIADPSVKSCSTDDEPLSSYPSGHTTMAYSMAAVMARLVPQKAPAIMARAADYAQSRIVCEQHFRSDVTAGQAWGMIVAERLMTDPAFRAQFDLAKSEVAAAVK